MSDRLGVAAHLIVGAREEPFLPVLLQSLEGVVDELLVNDNAGSSESPNARALAESSFGRSRRLVVDRAPFVDFANARNRVLALHREHAAGPWAAFVDADDVHRPVARCIAPNLETLPPTVAAVDAYTRHYLQSFRWYTAIERRMAFFRVTPEVHWEGAVHERLMGMSGTSLVVPYVYDHYGWVLPMERQAEKGRQYAALGQQGETYDETQLAAMDAAVFFRHLWPLALAYRGTHPAVVDDVRRTLEVRDAALYAEADRFVAGAQTPLQRIANVFRRLNFAYRWRGRLLDPRARALLACR